MISEAAAKKRVAEKRKLRLKLAKVLTKAEMRIFKKYWQLKLRHDEETDQHCNTCGGPCEWSYLR